MIRCSGLCSRCYDRARLQKRLVQRKQKRLEQPDRVREMERNQYARKPAGKQASARKYYDKNADICKLRAKRYRDAHPDERQAYVQNYRAMAASAGRHSAADRRAVFEFYGNRCCKCAEDLLKLPSTERHIDHVVPISRGGRNGIENLQLLCRRCNLEKADKAP